LRIFEVPMITEPVFSLTNTCRVALCCLPQIQLSIQSPPANRFSSHHSSSSRPTTLNSEQRARVNEVRFVVSIRYYFSETKCSI